MGTRNLTVVIKGGEVRVAQYGQFDGYPTGQGETIRKFLASKMKRQVFERKLEQITLVDQPELTKMWQSIGVDVDSDHGYVTQVEADRFNARWPLMQRNIAGEILERIQNWPDDKIVLSNQIEFANDGLMCEWVYVVDLDKNTLEVYTGFNTEPLAPTERFYKPDHTERYTPVRHIVSFNLDDLPNATEFVACCQPRSSEDD